MTLARVTADPAASGTWTLVPDRSSIRFSNKTMWGLVPVNGQFTEFTGEGRIAAQDEVSGRLIIQAASLKTGMGKRDEHLRSADFFDAEKFPQITIEVSGLGSDGSLNTTLSVRGTTLPLPLTVTAEPLGDGTLQVTARAEVDRTRWGVSGNMFGMMPTTTTLIADAVFVKA
jgi:polyisoprenoid-binding protein YceI